MSPRVRRVSAWCGKGRPRNAWWPRSPRQRPMVAGIATAKGIRLKSAGTLERSDTMMRRKIFGRVLMGILLLSWLMACTQGPEAPLAPTIATPSPLPNGIAGRSYAVGLKAARGEPPLSWSGRPAAGLALDARSGELMGTPEHAGSFQFPVTVTDGRARSHTKTFDLTVVSFPSGALAITSDSLLPQGIRGRAYSQQLEASGGGGFAGPRATWRTISPWTLLRASLPRFRSATGHSRSM